jgi:hypothetical protein
MASQPPQGSSNGTNFPVHSQGTLRPMNQQQFPNLPRMPGLMQQQLLGSIPSLNLQQLTSASSSVNTGAERPRNLDGPMVKKPKMLVGEVTCFDVLNILQ